MKRVDVLSLEALDSIVLAKGNHKDRSNGLCVMEVVAWVAGEEHTDSPVCVSPVIADFLRHWNDDLDDAGRQILKPYIPRVIGTVVSTDVEDARAWMLTDWIVRVHTPVWLRLAKLEDQAVALESLPRLDSPASAHSAQGVLNTARSKAYAARDAAWAAAWASTGAAAGAGAAAGDAAWAAASAALKSTVTSLQHSALDLLDRLIAAGRDAA